MLPVPPVDVAEFTYYIKLANAAATREMPVQHPDPVEIEGMGLVTFTDTGFCRGCTAILNELDPERNGANKEKATAIVMRWSSAGILMHRGVLDHLPRDERLLRAVEKVAATMPFSWHSKAGFKVRDFVRAVEKELRG